LPGNEPKKELIRVVKNKENEISLDFTGKKPGRGAYICKNVPVLRKPKRVENLKGPSRHPLVKRYMNYCERIGGGPCWRIELLFLGLARKANKLAAGYESCERLLKAGKAEL